jgi:hypothetical protein
VRLGQVLERPRVLVVIAGVVGDRGARLEARVQQRERAEVCDGCVAWEASYQGPAGANDNFVASTIAADGTRCRSRNNWAC